jgi:glycosyltransferase involved in cell wall biosynthesis
VGAGVAKFFMKLLICTQIIDSEDSNLGFFHRWVEEFSRHCERVTVVCLKEGKHSFPAHVRVLSLGKEQHTSRVGRVLRFFKYIYQSRNEYDAVFVHMNPEYVLLGGFLWRRWGKKIGLWYAHRSVTPKLKRAVRVVDRVFSVSTTSFKIPTPKLCAVGHGIDTELFTPNIHLESTDIRIVTTGRVAASKHLIEMLQVLDVLYSRSERFTFTVIGAATTPQEEKYAQLFVEEVEKRPYRDRVSLRGSLPHSALPEVLRAQDLFFNFAETGNMDKAGLEALALGIPVFSCNEAFEGLLAPFGLYAPRNTALLADTLQKFLNRPDRPAVTATLRNKVAAEHSLSQLIPQILTHLA